MSIDTKAIKQRYSLIDLAGQYTTLNRETATEYSGPCPLCGGEDRFHAKEDSFFCRQCYPFDNEQPHDVIAFVQFMGLVRDFKSACELLGSDTLPKPTTPIRTPEPKPNDGWKSSLWQSEVKTLLVDAQDRLWNRPDGEPGRAYLAERGFREDVAPAFDLGLADVMHPKLEEMRPALLMPWLNRNISAVQYRFIDANLNKTERFSQRSGGDRLLFGMHLFKWAEANTLFLVEGELNACSIWQATFRELPIHVASYGPQDNIQRRHVAELAMKTAQEYQRVIVWADEPNYAINAMNALGLPGIMAIRSPRGQDANDLLQTGQLTQFIERLLERYPCQPLPGKQ